MSMKNLERQLQEAGSLLSGQNKTRNQINEGLDELSRWLEEIQPSAPERPNLPGAAGLERVEVRELQSQDELRETAEQKLAGEKNERKRAIENEITARGQKYTEQGENARRAAKEQEESLNAALVRAREAVNTDALRRGIARSSIVLNREAGLENERLSQQNRISESLTTKINNIENSISSLTHEREQALNDFNIAHAARLTQSISSLQQEQERARRDAIAFNNSVAETERRAEIERQEKEESIHNTALRNRELEASLTNERQRIQSQIEHRFRDFLSSVPAAEARRLLLDNRMFRDNLPDAIFLRLFNDFAR